MTFLCHPYALVCRPYVTRYVTRMYSYIIRMSLVCSFTMNPYELVFYMEKIDLC